MGACVGDSRGCGGDGWGCAAPAAVVVVAVLGLVFDGTYGHAGEGGADVAATVIELAVEIRCRAV